MIRDVFRRINRLRRAIAASDRSKSPESSVSLFEALHRLATFLMPRPWEDHYENEPAPLLQTALVRMRGVDAVIAAAEECTRRGLSDPSKFLDNCDRIIYFAVKVCGHNIMLSPTDRLTQPEAVNHRSCKH